jgi:hypothetical protein
MGRIDALEVVVLQTGLFLSEDLFFFLLLPETGKKKGVRRKGAIVLFEPAGPPIGKEDYTRGI